MTQHINRIQTMSTRTYWKTSVSGMKSVSWAAKQHGNTTANDTVRTVQHFFFSRHYATALSVIHVQYVRYA